VDVTAGPGATATRTGPLEQREQVVAR
jgi:hypothetical protein